MVWAGEGNVIFLLHVRVFRARCCLRWGGADAGARSPRLFVLQFFCIRGDDIRGPFLDIVIKVFYQMTKSETNSQSWMIKPTTTLMSTVYFPVSNDELQIFSTSGSVEPSRQFLMSVSRE